VLEAGGRLQDEVIGIRLAHGRKEGEWDIERLRCGEGLGEGGGEGSFSNGEVGAREEQEGCGG